jgi:aspartate racemase
VRPRIGIVGGVGPAATVLYYEKLVAGYQERWAGRLYPEVVVHCLDLAWVTERFERDDLDSLTERAQEAVASLEASGCAFGLFSCNAMHLVFDAVAKQARLPLLDLRQLVVEEVSASQADAVALLATTFTVKSGLYSRPLAERGIKCLIPSEAEQDWLMSTINGELQRGCPSASSETRVVSLIGELAAAGARAVVVGCTDLPSLVHSGNSPLPVIDTAEVHVKSALHRAVELERSSDLERSLGEGGAI